MTGTEIVVPAEWAPQKAIWTAWPWDASEWNNDLDAPRRDVVALVRVLAAANRVRVLVNGEEAMETARAAIGDVADLIPAKYGDIWLRDTGPIFARSGNRTLALLFNVNGWGGKYDLADDATVGDRVAELAGAEIRRLDFVLEGGAVDHDGGGTILATRQTLLNANRNAWSEAAAEAALARAFGTKKVIWIDEGLLGDHTDGHIDNIARFVGPGRVVCQSPSGTDDPNAAILEAIAETLARETDAAGRRLEVIRIPSPGRVMDRAGEVRPANHMNFIIANDVVVVPVYGTATEGVALDALRTVFPNRAVHGVPSYGLLGSGGAGGGSFHCITQQEPL